MPFEPDIIVTGPDPSDVALIVEVSLSNRSQQDSERQLKASMASLGSPVGLLVTPERLRLYRDRYLPSAEDSITEVGEFDLNDILRFRPTRNAKADSLDFERNVQSWLEGLSAESVLSGLPPNLDGPSRCLSFLRSHKVSCEPDIPVPWPETKNASRFCGDELGSRPCRTNSSPGARGSPVARKGGGWPTQTAFAGDFAHRSPADLIQFSPPVVIWKIPVFRLYTTVL